MTARRQGWPIVQYSANASDLFKMNVLRYLEAAYYVSGVGLLIVAVLALRQIGVARNTLKVLKRDIVLRSQREAAALAAQQCEKYVEFFPKLNELKAAMKAIGLTPAKTRDHRFNLEFDVAEVKTTEARAWLKTLGEHLGLALDVLNKIDSIAIYFAKGVANEEIAFASIGESFCTQVEELYFLILHVHEFYPSSYESVIQLYKVW